MKKNYQFAPNVHKQTPWVYSAISADGSMVVTLANIGTNNARLRVMDLRSAARNWQDFAESKYTINMANTAQCGEVSDGNEVLAPVTFKQNGLIHEAIAANFLVNPAGSNSTASGSVIIVATKNIAGGAGNTRTITSFVSKNILSKGNKTSSPAPIRANFYLQNPDLPSDQLALDLKLKGAIASNNAQWGKVA